MNFKDAKKLFNFGERVRRPHWPPGSYLVSAVAMRMEEASNASKRVPWLASPDDLAATDWESCEPAPTESGEHAAPGEPDIQNNASAFPEDARQAARAARAAATKR